MEILCNEVWTCSDGSPLLTLTFISSIKSVKKWDGDWIFFSPHVQQLISLLSREILYKCFSVVSSFIFVLMLNA